MHGSCEQTGDWEEGQRLEVSQCLLPEKSGPQGRNAKVASRQGYPQEEGQEGSQDMDREGHLENCSWRLGGGGMQWVPRMLAC